MFDKNTVAVGLSKRGQSLAHVSPTPEYFRVHGERTTQPYHSTSRADGYMPFCVAENALVFDLLRAKMDESRDVTASWLGYQSMTGAPEFKRRLARFMSRKVFGRQIQPEHVAALAGAGSVLEILFYALADEGDAVLVPTPSYAGFWLDLETRDENSIVPVHTTRAEGFRLTPEHLERAMAESRRPVRALLFTTPNNPLGTVYRPRYQCESHSRFRVPDRRARFHAAVLRGGAPGDRCSRGQPHRPSALWAVNASPDYS